MPWKGVTVSEQRDRFLEDFQLNCYSTTELADRFGISRKTAYPGLTTRAGKWIARSQESGRAGYHELSRRPHTSCGSRKPHPAYQIGHDWLM
jgi:transposase